MSLHVPPADRLRQRVATIDWMCGLVMILMIVDHASMAFDGSHIDHDSAWYADAKTMALPAGEFFTRWITHLCAPTFVFLAGTSLAISIERRVIKGVDAWSIDKNILTRGAICAVDAPVRGSPSSQATTTVHLGSVPSSSPAKTQHRRLSRGPVAGATAG